jgi:hypothetical protein
MNNPRVIRTINYGGAGAVSSDCLEFDIEVMGNNATSRLWAFDIRFTYDNSVVDTIDFSLGSYFQGTGGQSPFYTGTATSVSGNLNVAVTSTKLLTSTNTALFKLVPSSWTLVGNLRLTIKNPSGIPNIGFIPSLMNGYQQEKTFASPWFRLYLSPNIYSGQNFVNSYIGRIYSSGYDWSQVGGTEDDVQYLDWSSSVNTSVWDGSATITQNDGVPALANNFRVESGATLTIPTNKWLTVAGNMVINGAASNLMVANGGSLIQSSANVPATVDRYIGAWGNAMQGWHLLSSPVTSQAIDPAFITPVPGNYDFYCWHEPSDLWVNFKGAVSPTWAQGNVLGPISGGGNFIPGKGYLVAYATASTKQFSGNLNPSGITATGLTHNGGTYQGWNLLGNPFPSALSWNNGSWGLTNVDGLSQIWKDSIASYVVINSNGIIPAMQGFMVHVPSGAGAVTIPASARTHSAQPWYKTSGNPYVKLVANDLAGQTAQESVVTFDNQATTSYDGEFDSYFLQGYAPQFYSVTGGENFAYNTLPNLASQTVIPFNFVKTSGSSYTIEASQIENVPSPVYLTDLKINHTQILGENPVYSFSSTDGDDPARFLLTFGNITGESEKTLNDNGVYAYENNLYLINPGKARLEIYNLTGQKLQSMEIDSPGMFKTTLWLPTAYYVVRVTTGNKVVVTKVFIKS